MTKEKNGVFTVEEGAPAGSGGCRSCAACQAGTGNSRCHGQTRWTRPRLLRSIRAKRMQTRLRVRRPPLGLCPRCSTHLWRAGHARGGRVREIFRFGQKHDVGRARFGGLDAPAVLPGSPICLSCCWRKAQKSQGSGSVPGSWTLPTSGFLTGRRCVEQRGLCPRPRGLPLCASSKQHGNAGQATIRSRSFAERKTVGPSKPAIRRNPSPLYHAIGPKRRISGVWGRAPGCSTHLLFASAHPLFVWQLAYEDCV